MIVEDEIININLLTSILKGDYNLVVEKNGHKAIERAERQLPDLILLDIMLPDIDGYTVINALKNSDRTKAIPVIFITSLRDVEDEEKGLNLGAVDYVVKPYNAAIIKARIRIHMQQVTQRKLLERIAMLDGLTEIPNRRSFTEQFTKEWERAVRNGSELSLIIADVDSFKQYNDHYGHGMGDMVLRSISRVLKDSLHRPGDFVARIGGEEFAVLLPETDSAGGYRIAERLRQAVEAMAISHEFSSATDHITVSVGGATIRPSVNDVQVMLFDKADQFLYEAKFKGKNMVQWHMMESTC